MPMVSLKLMAGAARSMVVFGSCVREERRLEVGLQGHAPARATPFNYLYRGTVQYL